MWEDFDDTKTRRFSPSNPVSSCSNTAGIRKGPNWIFREYNLKLTELSSINIVDLVLWNYFAILRKLFEY